MYIFPIVIVWLRSLLPFTVIALNICAYDMCVLFFYIESEPAHAHSRLFNNVYVHIRTEKYYRCEHRANERVLCVMRTQHTEKEKEENNM